MKYAMKGRPDTFLPFVENWRSWVEDAVFFRICEGLATPFVYAFLCHGGYDKKTVVNGTTGIIICLDDSIKLYEDRRFAERLAAIRPFATRC